jgi:hypothetical protein
MGLVFVITIETKTFGAFRNAIRNGQRIRQDAVIFLLHTAL